LPDFGHKAAGAGRTELQEEVKNTYAFPN